jgi:2',5'-phosphodiesterase
LRHVIASRLGHVAQLLTVQDKMTGRRLLVANTHLFYHPLASHIRLMQMLVLCRLVGRELSAANAAAVKCNSDDNGNDKDKDDCLVIMCGDFNSSLTNTAGRLATERHVPANFRDVQEHLRTFQWGKRRTAETGTVSTTPITSAAPVSTTETTTVADDFPEISLPDSFPILLPALTEIPSFTHYISGFFGALDHILIGQPGLKPVRHAPMPAVRDVARQTAMPSEHLPSDHVSLVCDVAIVHCKEE